MGVNYLQGETGSSTPMAMTTAPLHDRAYAGVMGEPDPAEPPRRRVRVAPSGDAAAGELVWEPGSVGAAGVFTVPLNPDGTITLETAGSTDVRVAVTGYWKIPTGNDTGLGLDLLEAPTHLVDTTTGTGICDASPCDTLESNTPVEVAVTGQGGLGGEIMAVMVSVTAIDPTGTGVLGVGTTEADLGGGIVVFDPAQHASTTMIIPLTDAGMFTIGSRTQTDVAVDVIGVFKAPTRTWRYEYDTTGMRTAKQLDNTSGTGAEWRKEHTWTASGGLPLLLAEHQGTQSAYVIYGPGGTAIYQINTTGDVQYLHQDHQGSTSLTTNPNGTTRNTITYNAHGEITANTNWWLEQPLNGYTGQYHDPETGYIYLRARHYDPTTGQFTSVDPLVAITEEPYGYVGGNPANGSDPTGLCGPFGDAPCTPAGLITETIGVELECAFGKNSNGSCRGAQAARVAEGRVGAVSGLVSGFCIAAAATTSESGIGVLVFGGCAKAATVVSTVSSVLEMVIECGTDPTSAQCYWAVTSVALSQMSAGLSNALIKNLDEVGDVAQFCLEVTGELILPVADRARSAFWPDPD